MSNSFFKRLRKEIQLYEKDNFVLPNLILKASDDLGLWYFIIYDLKETDFDDGVYLGKVILPNNYPFNPPDFQMLTPSNRFQINTKLCTSFSGYHKDLYSPSLNIAGMLHGLISFMTDDTSKPESRGIGGIYEATTEQKQQMAKDSRDFNMKNKFNRDIFEKYFSDYYDILKINSKEEEPKIEHEPEIKEPEIKKAKKVKKLN
jgi:ubiquitin-conjugating enzyme E2 J2